MIALFLLYSDTQPLSRTDVIFLHRVIKFIEDNISDADLDAQRICKEMAVSRTVLYSRIKLLTGKSVHGLIRMVRLQQSVRLLLEGEMSISQVAFEVGFNSHSYFDKCFARQYGMGPKEYINRKRRAK
ncbi:MAG TPA: AraC family transcriptional regulator [Puia sp.]|nr:AraC family transcriptional regulator [Puia sp.]